MNRATLRQMARVTAATAASLVGAAAMAVTDPAVEASITGVGVDLAKYGALMIAAGVAFFAVKAAGRKLGFWP